MFCEGEASSSVCAPGGRNVHFSKRCADSPDGLSFTAALVAASLREWQSVTATPATTQRPPTD
jgi:hypothetical protein